MGAFSHLKFKMFKHSNIRRLANGRTKEKLMKENMITDNITLPSLDVYSGDTLHWMTQQFTLTQFSSNIKTAIIDKKLATTSDFKFKIWLDSLKTPYVMVTNNSASIREANGIISLNVYNNIIHVSLNGTEDFCNKWLHYFNENFEEQKCSINWMFKGADGSLDNIVLPMKHRPALNSAYPWIKNSLESYINDYVDSESNILILVGPPGTGKSTFIKNMINQIGGDANVAYDPKVIEDDQFFVSYMKDEAKFLIMEDADNFLGSRSSGNLTMHKFLNISDGLVSSVNKKIIFSTNLPNINDIDPALMRPGRCYDVLQFRKLTRSEAQNVIQESGKDIVLQDGNEFTLAEIFSKQPSTMQNRKMGF